MQETGETRDAIIEDANKQIEKIINSRKNLLGKYWIVLFAKPSKHVVDGKPTLVQCIKAYDVKPQAQVGMVVGEVRPNGTIQWEVDMPQVPFDFDRLQEFGAERCDEVIVETTRIPNAYITK